MSDKSVNIVNNIKKSSPWIRVLFMLAFAALLYLVLIPVVAVFALAQALFSILGGDSNANLRYVAGVIELYISQIVKFLTYNTEEKPFPFSDLPEIDTDSIEQEKAQKADAPAASGAGKGNAASNTVIDEGLVVASKKTPAKKTASKKKGRGKIVKKEDAAKKPKE